MTKEKTHIHSQVIFFFNHTATTEIYTLSLHDALPISAERMLYRRLAAKANLQDSILDILASIDRKSTRLNSSHMSISYAVFCLKKKNTTVNIAECSVAPELGIHGLRHSLGWL